jgi:hypothetical protein
MRPQPSIEIVLRRTADSLEHAARETSDTPLAAHVLSPAAGLLRQIADSFDTYVAGRLTEIDRLAQLASAASALLDDKDSGRLDRLLDAATRTSGYLPATQLDELADSLHRELLAVQEKIETRQDRGNRELAEKIWAEQTARSHVAPPW